MQVEININEVIIVTIFAAAPGAIIAQDSSSYRLLMHSSSFDNFEYETVMNINIL